MLKTPPERSSNSEYLVRWCALAFAMLLPVLVTYTHLVLLAGAGAGNTAQQIVYIGGTVVQFTFPIFFIVFWKQHLPRPAKPTWRGMAFGLQYGLAVALGMIGLYQGFLYDTPLFTRTAVQVKEKFTEFGIATPAGFWLFAVFLTLLHSLLEEYYWRWFVFGSLRKLLPLWPAIILSSMAFTLHHIVLLCVWFPDQILLAVVPFSIATAIGGGVWAWLYDKSGSIWAAWLSHLLVDAGVFVVAYDLYFVR